jgi:hypothetical protein
MKVFQLFQAALGGVKLEDFGLTTECNYVVEQSQRLVRALVAYLGSADCLSPATHAALLAHKCVVNRTWEDSPDYLRQLDGIGPALAAKLTAAGLATFESVERALPHQLEAAVGRRSPWGANLKARVRGILQRRLFLEVTQTDGSTPTKAHFRLRISRGAPVSAGPVQPYDGDLSYTLLAMRDEVNGLFHNQR